MVLPSLYISFGNHRLQHYLFTADLVKSPIFTINLLQKIRKRKIVQYFLKARRKQGLTRLAKQCRFPSKIYNLSSAGKIGEL